MNLSNQEELILSISSLGHTGEGVGHLDGYTIFVDGALPGEVVKVSLYELHKSYGRANLLEIMQASPERIKPVCSLFGQCGGCQLMHLNYSEQLIQKQKLVENALKRIGKLNVTVEPCLPSPQELQYRNKIQLPVKQDDDGPYLGLYARSSHDLVKVDHCHIHCSFGEKIYQNIKELLPYSAIEPYDSEKRTGELRCILIKSSINLGEVLVVLVTKSNHVKNLEDFAEKIMGSSSSIKGVVQNINGATGNSILGNRYKLLCGSMYIRERLSDLYFHISPASFFQVNPSQAEKLFQKALEISCLKGDETILDAYCGVGTLSLYFARHCKKIIGVECVPEAIKDAKENAKLNAIDNAMFVCAYSEEYIKNVESIDVIILNPPRKGCEKSFLEGIKKIKPKQIIYISCNPSTLARDLSILHSYGYAIEVVYPFDMFPQTAHVECLVKLTAHPTFVE
jgi:23S rRNA (uracil1939-C5)-methyltransferase